MAKKKKPTTEEVQEFDFEFTEEDTEEAMNVPMLTKTDDDIQLPEAWGQSASNMMEIAKFRESFNLKHGLLANVPMICKGSECPMHELCTIPIRRRPVYKRCPIEIAAIIDRYDKYCKELNIGPEDYFDQSQVKDLVDIEIKLMRANGVLAISGDFIQEVTAGIDDKGNEFTRPELHKATEYEEKLLNRKYKILADLNSTRRAKKENNISMEASSFASDLMRRARLARQKMNFIDIEAEIVNEDHVKSDMNPLPEGEIND